MVDLVGLLSRQSFIYVIPRNATYNSGSVAKFNSYL